MRSRWVLLLAVLLFLGSLLGYSIFWYWQTQNQNRNFAYPFYLDRLKSCLTSAGILVDRIEVISDPAADKFVMYSLTQEDGSNLPLVGATPILQGRVAIYINTNHLKAVNDNKNVTEEAIASLEDSWQNIILDGIESGVVAVSQRAALRQYCVPEVVKLVKI